MAQEALKKLEDQLNCSICLGTYTDPKQLQCNHVYCRKCLVKLVFRDRQGELILSCPICRQVTPVPGNGVTGFPPAFHINNLLELYDSFKKIDTGSSSDAVATKMAHEEKEIELYCDTCEQLICSHCALKTGKHHNCEYKMLDEAFQKYREEITPSLEPMEKQLVAIKEALTLIDARCGEISDQRAATEANIHITFRRLHEILDARQTQLIDQLKSVTRWKLKGLAAQRKELETTLSQLSSCLDCVKQSLRQGRQADVLKMKTAVAKQVKELTTTFQPGILKPNAEANVVFSAATDLDLFQTYGQITVPALLDISECPSARLTERGMDMAVVGVKSTTLVNFEGNAPVQSSECELVSDITGSRTRGSVERRGQSQYEISYQPTIKGRHQLHIIMEGQHIRGSPFPVAVTSSVEKLGTPLRTIDGIKNPWGVAINQRGEVVVTENSRKSISIFSPSGKKLRSFGVCGSGQGQVRCFRGVAIDDKGHIIAVDRDNACLHKYTENGELVKTAGSRGNGPLQFLYPTGVAFNTFNYKLYVVDGNHRVQILNSDLTFSAAFGPRGSGEGQFNYPTYVACDSSGNVYVADSGNYRIQVFTAEGIFLKMFAGELKWPVGIAIDANNKMFVAEGEGHRVSMLTTEGQIVSSLGKRGAAPGEFKRPRGVALDNSGVVYVCDFYNNRVQLL